MTKKITDEQTTKIGNISRVILKNLFNVEETDPINEHLKLVSPRTEYVLVQNILGPRAAAWRTTAEDTRHADITILGLSDNDATVVANQVIGYKKSHQLTSDFERQVAIEGVKAGGIEAEDRNAIQKLRSTLKSIGMTEVSDFLARGLIHYRGLS